MPHTRRHARAIALNQRAIQQVKSPGVDRTPRPDGWSTFASPSRRGAKLGARLSPGSATVAKALSRGATEHIKLAESGIRGNLPPSLRAEYLRRVTKPFYPPPSAGVVTAIATKEAQARATSGLVSREVTARLDFQRLASRVAAMEKQLGLARKDAKKAAAETARAARNGKPFEARIAYARARNARVRTAQLGRTIVESTAKAGRQAIIAGAIENMQQTSATPAKVQAIRTFEASHARMALPSTLTKIPDPIVDSTEPESVARERLWVLGAPPAEAIKALVMQAAEEAEAANDIFDDVYKTANHAEAELIGLYEAAVRNGGVASLSGFGQGPTGTKEERILRTVTGAATIATGLVGIYSLFSKGAASQPSETAATPATAEEAAPEKKGIPPLFIAAGIGGAALLGLGIAMTLRG